LVVHPCDGNVTTNKDKGYNAILLNHHLSTLHPVLTPAGAGHRPLPHTASPCTLFPSSHKCLFRKPLHRPPPRPFTICPLLLPVHGKNLQPMSRSAHQRNRTTHPVHRGGKLAGCFGMEARWLRLIRDYDIMQRPPRRVGQRYQASSLATKNEHCMRT